MRLLRVSLLIKVDYRVYGSGGAECVMHGDCCDAKDRHLPTTIMDNFIRRLISPPKKKVSKYVRAGTVAADLGCGPGYFTIPMAELVGEGGKVYAVDSDAKSIQKLRQKMGLNLRNIVDSRIASAARVDRVRDASVDFVFANGLLCCMSDHNGAIAEIKRILKPTGLAYLSVTKFYRKNDPRAVRKEEWNHILQGFGVKEMHEGFLNRWALVSLRKSTPQQSAPTERG